MAQARPTGWLDGTTVAIYWGTNVPSSPLIDELLDAAKIALLKWRRQNGITEPAADATDGVPANLREAQYMQAKANFQSDRSNADDDAAGGEQVVRLYPMDAKIKRLALADSDHGIVIA